MKSFNHEVFWDASIIRHSTDTPIKTSTPIDSTQSQHKKLNCFERLKPALRQKKTQRLSAWWKIFIKNKQPEEFLRAASNC